MGYVFDGPTKKIQLTSGTTEAEIADMYSRWYDWFLTSDNSKYLPAFRNVGGDPTSDTEGLGITFFLVNGWRIVPQSADHRLILTGNLYTDPFGYSPIDTVPGYSIIVEYAKSNLIDRIETGVSGLTEAESDQLMGTALEDGGRLQDVDDRLPSSPASEAAVVARPTLVQIEASTILAKQTELIRALGLAQENFRVKNQVYDEDGNLTTATVRTYSSADDAQNDVNPLAEYVMAATFTGPAQCTGYLLKRIA